MVDVPKWERLADALKRVTGVSEHEAQVALCRAISEHKIRVRLWLGNFERGDHYLLQGIMPNVGLIMPPHIAPQDFDWSESRPLKPWRNERDGIGGIFKDWRRHRIELYSADVTRVLIAPRSGPRWQRKAQSNNTRPARSSATNPPRHTRHQPARELAKKAIAQLFKNNIPDRTANTDQKLCGEVRDWLKKNGCREVSTDTILRAAGRRKDRKGRSRHG